MEHPPTNGKNEKEFLSHIHPAVWALCAAMILSVIGCFVLAFLDKEIPQLLGLFTASLIGAVGATIGIIAKRNGLPTAPTTQQPPPN